MDSSPHSQSGWLRSLPLTLLAIFLPLLATAQNLTDSQINLVSARLAESAQRPCVFTEHRQTGLLTPSFLPPVGSWEHAHKPSSNSTRRPTPFSTQTNPFLPRLACPPPSLPTSRRFSASRKRRCRMAVAGRGLNRLRQMEARRIRRRLGCRC